MGVIGGAAFVFREIARGLAKFVPGWGNVVSGAVAAKGTWAIGEAAIAYFIDHSDIDRAKAAMGNALKTE